MYIVKKLDEPRFYFWTSMLNKSGANIFKFCKFTAVILIIISLISCCVKGAVCVDLSVNMFF